MYPFLVPPHGPEGWKRSEQTSAALTGSGQGDTRMGPPGVSSPRWPLSCNLNPPFARELPCPKPPHGREADLLCAPTQPDAVCSGCSTKLGGHPLPPGPSLRQKSLRGGQTLGTRPPSHGETDPSGSSIGGFSNSFLHLPQKISQVQQRQDLLPPPQAKH